MKNSRDLILGEFLVQSPINRAEKIGDFGLELRVRVFRSRPHDPTGFILKYPLLGGFVVWV